MVKRMTNTQTPAIRRPTPKPMYIWLRYKRPTFPKAKPHEQRPTPTANL